MTHLRQILARLLSIVGLLVIAVATLYPLPGAKEAASMTPFWCVLCGSHGLVDILLNLLLFVPFALGLRLVGLRGATVVALAALVSVTVEFLQFGVIPGRDASISDILTNTSGGAIGVAVAAALGPALRPPPHLALRLAAAATAAWLGILAVTAYQFEPWAPYASLRSQWARPAGGREPFRGRVLHASVAGIPTPEGPIAGGRELGRRLRRGRLEVDLSIVSGPPTRGLRVIFALLGRGDLALLVQQSGTDLVVVLPAEARRWRLRPPAVRLAGGLPSRAGERVRVRIDRDRYTIGLLTSSAAGERRAEFTLTPALGWGLLLPFEYAFDRSTHLLTGLWIAGLLLPVGYWASRARGRRGADPIALAAFGGAAAVGLWLLPLLVGFPPVHWSGWVAALAAGAAGAALAARGTYLPSRCASPSISGSCSS